MTDERKNDGVTFELPFPPSNNNYYRSMKTGRVLISEKGRNYRTEITLLCISKKIPKFGDKLLWAIVDYHPKDNRVGDIDNYTKPLFDALQISGVCNNDKQIKKHCKTMMKPNGKGTVLITLKEFDYELHTRCVC